MEKYATPITDVVSHEIYVFYGVFYSKALIFMY